ncbi:MAG: hypothetical protein GY832_22490 [Chloroflexi bacterium]|nr:hypothetical protein [Chloroflexota bacterium]
MPLPAIGALLAGIGKSVAAKVAASGVAEAGAAMAAKGTAAASGAATRFGGIGSLAGTVIESAPGNARDITAMLAGFMPGDGGGVGAGIGGGTGKAPLASGKGFSSILKAAPEIIGRARTGKAGLHPDDPEYRRSFGGERRRAPASAAPGIAGRVENPMPGMSPLGSFSQEDIDSKVKVAKAKKAQDEVTSKFKDLAKVTVPVVASLALFSLAVIKGTHALVVGRLESSRELRRFSAAVANTFAQLDRQQLVHKRNLGQATSGSTSRLGDAVMALRDETQWIRIALVTAANVAAETATHTLRLANLLYKLNPYVIIGVDALKKIEFLMSKGDDGPVPYQQFLLDMEAGKFRNEPKVQPPDPGGFTPR